MASSPKDKFDAAVKVIRGLPKNGPFQPSHDLLLKFYSYYKQATEGPCTAPKPGFWDLVNKKKWEAWTSLGDMAREKAMILYVDELKKVSNHVRETYYPPKCASREIVETMPQTEEVTCFLQKLDTFYEMVEDQEGQNEDQTEVRESQPNGVVPHGQENGGDSTEGELNYSENMTLMLKQDMKRAGESNGIVTPHKHHDIKSERNDSNGFGHKNGRHNGLDDNDDDDDDDEEDEDECDGPDFVPITPKREVESPTGSDAPKINGRSQAWSDSETEYEEFCDTSDDVLESRQAHANSDSLLVNVSENAGNALAHGLNASEYRHRDESDDGGVGPKGFLHCRGGDDAGDKDRRRRNYGGRGTSHGAGRQESAGGGSGGHGGSDGSSSSRGPPSGSGGGGQDRSSRGLDGGQSDLNEQIVVTLLRLQRDVSGVLNRLNSLEALVKEGRMEKERQSLEKKKSWWPFNGMTFNSVAVIFLWPLFVHIVLTYLSQRRRRFTR